MNAAVPMLERAMVWDTAGHLADAAVTALADGERALLPPDAVQHAETCPACAERIGHAALFALEVAEALDAELALALSTTLSTALSPAEAEPAAPQHALARAPATALARREPATLAGSEPSSHPPAHARAPSSLAPPAPLPVKAVVAALLVALVAAGPWLSTLRPGSLAETLAHFAGVLARAVDAARAAGIAELAWLAAGVLGLLGAVVARMAARPPARLAEGMR